MATGRAQFPQRTLLKAGEEPPSRIVQAFKSSHLLSTALAKERVACANGQVAYLRRKEQQLAYVHEAKQRPKPPSESITLQQVLLSELRGGAPDHTGRTLPPAILANTNLEPLSPPGDRRLAQQAAFLVSRKARHDQALTEFDLSMQGIHEDAERESAAASKLLYQELEASEAEANALLGPLEHPVPEPLAISMEGTEGEVAEAEEVAPDPEAEAALKALGERTEAEVLEVMQKLTARNTAQRARVKAVAGDSGELATINLRRQTRAEQLLKQLAEDIYQIGHIRHVKAFDAEKIVQERTLAFNEVLSERVENTHVLFAKLMQETEDQGKAMAERWQQGLLLWKRQRHRHSLSLVMARVESREFHEPQSLLDLLAKLRSLQQDAYQARRTLLQELFSAPMPKLTMAQVRTWEEQNTAQNDRAQEAFDGLLAELKDLREALEVAAERMLGELSMELEIHGARQEWGNHDTVASLVDTIVRPPLRERLEAVSTLLRAVTDALSRQEEAQHFVVSRLVAFFLALARRQELLKRHVEEFEVEYKGELEDCEKDFEETSSENEAQMKKFHEDINAAAHHEDLDKLKQEAFDKLDAIAQGYNDHAEQMLNIHNRYPGQVAVLARQETQGFCRELGLALSPAEAARFNESTAAEAEHPGSTTRVLPDTGFEPDAEVLAGSPIWLGADGTGCEVVEWLPLGELLQCILTAEVGAEEGAVQGLPTYREGEEEPKLLDGALATEPLHFAEDWLAELLAGTRTTVFSHLAEQRRYLDRVDIPGHCEAVRTELDQRVRRHTNRKGEVQVEWYVPRYGIIAKHKDKFERHLLEMAKKNQSQDAAVEQIFKDMEEAAVVYKDKLAVLVGRLSEAETLPLLTAFERQANDQANTYKEHGRQALQKLMDLSTKAPQGLQRENRNFLSTCRWGEENYSEVEVKFYGDDVEALNKRLDEKAQDRADRAKALEVQLEQKRQVPLAEFTTLYQQAVERLCASKGYGRKYGEPRRKAQLRCRTLIARATTAQQNIEELLNYLRLLLQAELPARGALDQAKAPKPSPLLRFPDYFKKGGEPWVFTGELIGTFYIVVCTMDVLGSHLGAFKAELGSRFQIEAAPLLRVLRGAQALLPVDAAGDPKEAASLEAELALREDCLLRALGPLLKAETFGAEVKSIVETSHDAYKGQPGGTPDFMQKFLAEMQTSAEVARQEASRSLRSWVNELREETLINLGAVLFGELCSRSLAELRTAAHTAWSTTVTDWSTCDAQRAAHEQRLSPSLSNPNAEAQLTALVEAEAERYQRALQMLAEDRARMSTVLRSAAANFVQGLASLWEQAVRLIDALPLHGHFGSLPGDEKLEPPRMSIKRRLRRLGTEEAAAEPPAATAKAKAAPAPKAAASPTPAATSMDTDTTGLPQRTWLGLPRQELRALLIGHGWPEDPELLQEDGTPDSAKLQELTPSLESFRSPVHRRLFESRGHFYAQYQGEFTAEVERRCAELAAREEKEVSGEQSWQSMVRQLKGDS